VAVGGIVTINEVGEITRIDAGATAIPLTVTAVVPVKLVPEIVSELPRGPEAGAKDEIFGLTLKFALVAVPLVVITCIGPVVASSGTVIPMVVEVCVRIIAGAPLISTIVK